MSDRFDNNRASAKSMAVGHAGSLLFALLMAGCAMPGKMPASDPATKDTAPIVVAAPVAPTGVTSPAETHSINQPAIKSAAPSARTPAPAAPSAKSPASSPAKSAAPPLDLKSLETRLKETNAIGVFTKIALKNQVDDLLDQFRAHHRGQLKTKLSDLRRPYEMLLQKVLALLQDSDPPLAGEIVASREAIWGILADPARFAAI